MTDSNRINFDYTRKLTCRQHSKHHCSNSYRRYKHIGSMTLEQYLQQPFKTDDEGKDVLIADEWQFLTRRQRRYVVNALKHGKVPNFVDEVLEC